jgi:3-isopropylmalate/(R)-2-methylmalate dehydratase small subunit
MRKPFRVVEAVGAPIDMVNVDTDQIIPLHRIMRAERTQSHLADSFFYNHRFDEQGDERPDFVLNRDAFRNAEILVAADNFGCGSSREVAVVAMQAFGIRAVVAPSFGDIFFSNCAQNGILAVRLPEETCADLRTLLRDAPGRRLRIDLEQQTIAAGNMQHVFEIDPMKKDFLLLGVDEIDFTQQYLPAIDAWESDLERREPWSVLSR